MENCTDSLRILIGIAEAVALEDFSDSFLLISGEGELRPAGVEIFSADIQSSIFMGS